MHRCEIQHVDMIYSSINHYNYVDMTYESMKTPVGGLNCGWSTFGPVEEGNTTRHESKTFFVRIIDPIWQSTAHIKHPSLHVQ